MYWERDAVFPCPHGVTQEMAEEAYDKDDYTSEWCPCCGRQIGFSLPGDPDVRWCEDCEP